MKTFEEAIDILWQQFLEEAIQTKGDVKSETAKQWYGNYYHYLEIKNSEKLQKYLVERINFILRDPPRNFLMLIKNDAEHYFELGITVGQLMER